MNGPAPLTPRQADVARLVAEGWTNKYIAAELGCTERRVRQIIGRIAEIWHLDARRSYRAQIVLHGSRAA